MRERPRGFLHRLFERREKTLGYFGDRERVQLEKHGAIILEVTGKSLNDLRKSGRKVVWSLAKSKSTRQEDTRREQALASVPSHRGEIAFFPDPTKFFVPDSAGKTLVEQEILAQKDGERMRKEFGVDGLTVAIPKEASTLVEMAYFYFGAKGCWLFSSFYHHYNARTMQYTDAGHTAEVGFANEKLGLSIFETPVNRKADKTVIVRLIIPR